MCGGRRARYIPVYSGKVRRREKERERDGEIERSERSSGVREDVIVILDL